MSKVHKLVTFPHVNLWINNIYICKKVTIIVIVVILGLANIQGDTIIWLKKSQS